MLAKELWAICCCWARESIFIKTVALYKSTALLEGHMFKNLWAVHTGLNIFKKKIVRVGKYVYLGVSGVKGKRKLIKSKIYSEDFRRNIF